MRHLSDKIVDDASLKNICRQAKAEGKTIVSTSGCFDLLHAGHVKYLEQAKEKGDLLILLLNSDASVKRLKGAQRPIVNQLDRAAVAAGLESVDYLCLFDEDTPCGLIRTLRPDIVVKGGDYEGKQIPEMDAVHEYGGRTEYVQMEEGRSTTGLLEKIRRTKDKNDGTGGEAK